MSSGRDSMLAQPVRREPERGQQRSGMAKQFSKKESITKSGMCRHSMGFGCTLSG